MELYFHAMQQSALLETLSLLCADELLRFQKFVLSPYFNDGPYSRDTVDLLTFLLPFGPAFESEEMTIERAYVAVYPQKTFVKGKIEVVMSKLHQLLKQFAAQQTNPGLEEPEPLRLATFFLDRGAAHRAAPLLEKLRTEQASTLVHDEHYWMLRFLTAQQMHRLDTLRQNNHDRESLSEAIWSAHHGYLVQSLYLLNDLFFSARKSKINNSFAEEVARAIPTMLTFSDVAGEPLLRLLSRGFEFARHPECYERLAFEAFLTDLRQHESALPFPLLITIYGYARNYCTWHANRGDTDYLPLLFDLFQYSFDRDLLYLEGKIPAVTLLNLAQTAFALQQLDWLKNALERCRERISGVTDTLGFYHYLLANWHYHQHDYDAALDLIPMASDGLFNGLMLRKLEIKIYYETESPLLDSKVDNFKLFVFRQGKKHLVENIFQMNNAFIDMLRSMMATDMLGNFKKIEKLRQKLTETQLIAERKWLETQLERLASKVK